MKDVALSFLSIFAVCETGFALFKNHTAMDGLIFSAICAATYTFIRHGSSALASYLAGLGSTSK